MTDQPKQNPEQASDSSEQNAAAIQPLPTEATRTEVAGVLQPHNAATEPSDADWEALNEAFGPLNGPAPKTEPSDADWEALNEAFGPLNGPAPKTEPSDADWEALNEAFGPLNK